MKLNQFLLEQGISKSAFARKIGTTAATVSRIGDGLVVPRRGLLERIYEQTEGRVTPNDLVGLYCINPCRNVHDERE
jgi:predicted transcriptional regulator